MSLPAIQMGCSNNLIRPLPSEQNEPPLTLRVGHGRREFKVKLRVLDNENGARISFRHLAEVVLHETGIVPREQKYYFRGIGWSDPDLGPWSPALRDLGLKNGDKVQLVTYHHAVPDWEAVEMMETLEKTYASLRAQLHTLFYRVQGLHQGYVQPRKQLILLAGLRQQADTLKNKLMALIKKLNALEFDHRNYAGQAKRRETVDNAQRQIDKCVDVSTSIFHKLAQSQQLAHTGSLYGTDPLLLCAARAKAGK